MRIKNLNFGTPTTGNLTNVITKEVAATDFRFSGYVTFDIDDGEDNITSYRTNTHGEGLWVWKKNWWHQILGTGQFNLQCSPNAARKRIRKELKGDYEWVS